MDYTTLRTALPALLEQGLAVELVGPPGVGKTSFVRQFAAAQSKALGAPFGLVVWTTTVLSELDVGGIMFRDGDGARFSRPPIFPTPGNIDVYVDGRLALRPYSEVPELGIVLLDEFGHAPMEVQKPLAPFILERRVNEYRLPDGWRVLMASNRHQDRSGVQRRAAFVANRICRIEVSPSLSEQIRWFREAGVRPDLIAFVRHEGKLFADAVPEGSGDVAFCTPRSFYAACRAIMALGDTHPALAEVLSGLVGAETAAKLIGFLSHGKELVPIEAVVAEPEKARLPKPELAALNASVLAHACPRNPKAIGALMAYLSRLDRDVQAVAVSALLEADIAMASVPEVKAFVRADPGFRVRYMLD